MAAISADMANSQVPAPSPIKSPKRPRDYGTPVTEIPDSETAPKKHKADDGSKSIRNRLTTLETRRAKCKRPLQVLREHAKNFTCTFGLQYRPKPHNRFDWEFQTVLDQISLRAHTELLAVNFALLCLSLTLNLPIPNDTFQRVIQNAPADETVSINF